MARKKTKGINPDLENAINSMLNTVATDSEMPLLDKLRVIDRALNLEKIKQKMLDDDWGTGFLDLDEEETKSK